MRRSSHAPASITSRLPAVLVWSALSLPAAAQALSPVWQAQIDGPAHYDDYATSVAVMPSGNVAVAGFVFTEPQPGYFVPQFVTALYSPQGAPLWSQLHGSGWYGGNGAADKVAIAPGNKIVTAGTRDLGSTVMVVQYDAFGNLEWEGLWLAASYWVAYVEDLDIDSGGSLYVCSSISGGAGVAKFGADGTLLWSQVFTGTGLEIGAVSALTISSSGAVFLTGSTTSPSGLSEFSVARIDPATGAPMWIRQHGPSSWSQYVTGLGLGSDAGGNAVAGGIVANPVTLGADLSFVSYAPDGTFLWRYDHTGPGAITGMIEDMQVDAAGTIAVVGSTTTSAGDLDGFALLLHGSQFGWQQTFGGAAQLDDYGTAVRLDAQGNLIAAGSVLDPEPGFDVYHFSPDGSLQAHGRAPVPSGGDGFARDLALGSSGGVFVVGDMSSFPGTGGDGVIAAFELDVLLTTSFCSGDGSAPGLIACPCGNTGAPTRGCQNSAGTGGSHLAASGTTSPDTVVLGATDELPVAPTIFLQATATVGPGLPFGDGVRCIAGFLLRLKVKPASGGAVAYPTGTEPTITTQSAALGDPIPAGATRYYQAYYRDPDPAFCPVPAGNGWNVSNAVSIQW